MGRVPLRFTAWLAAAWLTAPVAHAADQLRIYFIDVEGGQSTLIAGPSGESLLIDTGYGGFNGRDARRIAAAAKDAGVKRIDHLVITHFHDDHVGGVENLVEKLPVVNFYDHGPSIETKGYPAAYEAALAQAKHTVLEPGATIPVKGLKVTVVASAGKTIQAAGVPNPYCEGIGPRSTPDDNNENSQSLALLIEWNKFRFADFGDITWNRELSLMCPENKIGQVDLYLMTHHGGQSPKAIWGMQPRVAIMNNGSQKGGDPAGWMNIQQSPGLENLWQLHFSIAGGGMANAPDVNIANLREGTRSDDAGNSLKVTVEQDGSFTVYNARNKFSKKYAPR